MEMKKKVGRPEAGDKKRSKVLRIRLTEMEYNAILEDAKKVNLKPSEIGREYVTKGYITNLFSEEEQAEKRKLIGLSNNLNQLTRLAQMGGYVSQEKSLDSMVSEIDSILKKYNYVSKGDRERKRLFREN